MGLIRVMESLQIVWFDWSSFSLQDLSSEERAYNYCMCSHLCVSAPMVNRSTKPNGSSKSMSPSGNVTGKVFGLLYNLFQKRYTTKIIREPSPIFPTFLIMGDKALISSMSTDFLPLLWPLPTRFQSHLTKHDAQKYPTWCQLSLSWINF